MGSDELNTVLDLSEQVADLSAHDSLEFLMDKKERPATDEEGYAAHAMLESAEFHSVIMSSNDSTLRAKHAQSIGMPVDEVIDIYGEWSDEHRHYCEHEMGEIGDLDISERMEIEEHYSSQRQRTLVPCRPIFEPASMISGCNGSYMG